MKTTENHTLLTLQEASDWASRHLGKKVSVSNISYLIQYGKLKKYSGINTTLISLEELEDYYKSLNQKQISWKEKLGDDLNWNLSFDNLREKDTTKHVHRLHPYKGKYIPQLVEYFIDNHINEFKKDIYFNKGDVILDPFSGSGTAVVQANELGIHGIGIDISFFNSIIAESKIQKYNNTDLVDFHNVMFRINCLLSQFETDSNIEKFDDELSSALSEYNKLYFPAYQFKRDIISGKTDEKIYSSEKEKIFLNIYENLISKYNIKLANNSQNSFLDTWYISNIRNEIEFVKKLIEKEKNEKIKKLFTIILSRTLRSCRATTHYDLGTLKEPQLTPYYCYKHRKICKPLYSIKKFLKQYADDTFKRIAEFQKIRTDSFYSIITGDSREINIFEEVKKQNTQFYELLARQKIKGIFSSPPYVGQIDYHEQHSYSYELFEFERRDSLEIGQLSKGKSQAAREKYINDISDTLINCKKYLVTGYEIFLVANDTFNIYPIIAEKAGLKIIAKHKRPVLNRSERDKNPYCEYIFQMKEK